MTGHPFVQQVEADPILVLGFSNCVNDFTQLLYQGLGGQEVQVCDNPGATWIHPHNFVNVKGSNVSLPDEDTEVQVAM